MKYTWDEKKCETNIKKHKIDFVDAVEVFDDFFLSDEDKRQAYGETRYACFGLMRGFLIKVVYVNVSEHETRVISARKATNHEEKFFRRYFKK
jgi:hypothetical protein